jgi:ATP-dependent Zn protease
MDSQRRIPNGYLWAGLLAILAAQLWLGQQQQVRIDYSDFKALLRAGDIRDVRVAPTSISGSANLKDTQVGPGYLGELGSPLAKEFSEATARKIDAEIHRVLCDAEARVHATLTARRGELEALAQMLLREETVGRDALLGLLAAPRRVIEQAALPAKPAEVVGAA